MDTTHNTTKKPGDFIDRYKIISILGEGGMGVVYKAHDSHLNKEVALKLVRGVSANLHMRFHQEAKALRDLKHPSIPEIYDFAISENDEPFMIIDYIEGKSLKEHLSSKGKLSLKETFEIINPLCKALYYAHEHSIVHRDVKPDNIILSTDDTGLQTVKVIDFGLAHIDQEAETAQGLTKTGNVLGSAKYMSPEQAKGMKATKVSDTYSVGVVLFEMLAGRPPYQGNTSLETISMHVTNSVEDSFQHLPEEYRQTEVADIISQAMAKDPEDRFAEIVSIADRLKNYLEELAKPVIDIPEFEQTSSSSKEIAKIALLSAAVIAVLGLVSYGGFKLLSKPHDETVQQMSKTNRLEEKSESRQSGGQNVSTYIGKTGFQYLPKKGNGYYAGAENITDNDFASLRKVNPKPIFVTSNKSYTVTGSGIYYMRGLGVKRLDLESPELTDEVLKNAALLPDLYDLTISATNNLSTTGFKYLHKIKELRILNIENCKVDSGMVEELSKLNQLYGLSLKGCKSIKNSDLKTLSRLQGLNSLAIDFTSITPDGLKHLSRFKNLHALKCEYLGITDNDLPHIAKLPLVSLDISDNKITAKGLRLLSKSKALVRLDAMNQSWVNDKSLGKEELTNLKRSYRKAAKDFLNSNNNRRIRWEFGTKDPCK